MKVALLVAALAAALQVMPGDGARILAVFPFPSPSHMHVLNALTKALAARGHQLVVVSPFPQKKLVDNYTDVDLMPVLKKYHEQMGSGSLYNMRDKWMFEVMSLVWDMSLSTTEVTLTSPQLKQILNDKQGFDLVITEIFMNEALYGLAHYFKV
jgi:glucuronosyltransferase